MAEAKTEEQKEAEAQVKEEQERYDAAKGADSAGPTQYSGVPRVQSEVDPYDPMSPEKEVERQRLQGPSSRGDDPPVHVLTSEETAERGEKYAKTRVGAK